MSHRSMLVMVHRLDDGNLQIKGRPLFVCPPSPDDDGGTDRGSPADA